MPALTPANTGLESWSEYPELGSSFKAAQMKVLVWGMARKLRMVLQNYQDQGKHHVISFRISLDIYTLPFSLSLSLSLSLLSALTARG